MSIRVTCPGCHTRFSVDERFAGREGPCPKCKAPIRIPDKSEEVQVHAPQSYGPKSASGRGVLKPIFRTETIISPVQIVLILAVIVGFLAGAALIRFMVEDKASLSSVLLCLLSTLLAFATAYAGYTFLRDSELAPFRGQELWLRVLACAIVYALLWFAVPISAFTFDDLTIGELGQTSYSGLSLGVGIAVMFALGAGTASLIFGLDFLMGILHFGMFVACAVLLRVVAGLSAISGMGASEVDQVAASIASGLSSIASVLP